MMPTALALYVQTGLIPSNDPTPPRDPVWGEPIVPAAELAAIADADSISDARLLVLPVRSLRGLVVYVTCPAVLRHLVEQTHAPLGGHTVDANTAIVAPACPCRIDGRLVVEEFGLESVASDTWPTTASWIAERFLPPDEVSATARQRLALRLALIDDALFAHLAGDGLPRQRRRRAGTISSRPLLPPESLLYALFRTEAAAATWHDRPPAPVWLGHGRSVGTGLVTVRPLELGVSP
jgi:CRISPR-associated protein Cmr4